jgi:hypothetical protein
MTNLAQPLFDLALRLRAVFQGRTLKQPHGMQGSILHDPGGQKPKDLDNPFNDADAQERVGYLIARSYPEAERKQEK